MHGADRDIIWLQRDFGIYVCNLFDTGQVLTFASCLFGFLCNENNNKTIKSHVKSQLFKSATWIFCHH